MTALSGYHDNPLKSRAAGSAGVGFPAVRQPHSEFNIMHTLAIFSFCAFPLLVASAAQAQVVKCVDAKGRVEYAKSCAPGTSEAGRIQRDATPTPAPRDAPTTIGSGAGTDVDPQLVINAEDNVCNAAGQLASARKGLAEGGSVSIEQLAGEKISDPRQRQAMQQRLDASLQATQRDMVASSSKSLANYQAEYKRLAGSEFNTRLCDDKEGRVKRREAAETQRMEAIRRKQTDQFMSNEGEGGRAICREKQAMDGPSKEALKDMSQEQIDGAGLKERQEMARARYAQLVESYERIYGRRFDPARCR